VIRPEEVDEIRIVAAWTAAHRPPGLPLEEGLDSSRLRRFLEAERTAA
jgi:hypothetical protein